MTFKDSITLFTLGFGLILGSIVFILSRHYKWKQETWPYKAGLVGGIYLFVPLMLQSILSRPLSELVGYTVANIFWSLFLGGIVYFSVRGLVTNRKKEENQKSQKY
jgi:uncharacterized membrane protein YdcZ (DUF606 family)